MRLPPAVSIVGLQDSGKTRLVTRLVRHFVKAGLRVGTLKHASHSFDVPKKDSHQHFGAGAAVTVLAGPGRLAHFRREKEPSLREILGRFFRDVDLVLVEGYRRERIPRIEVHRRAISPAPSLGPVDAVVSDATLDSATPQFRPGEIARIAAFIRSLGRSRGRSKPRRRA